MENPLIFGLTYLLTGAITGLLAGLLGLGGGIIIVPLLTITLAWQGFSPDFVMRSALATSMASIIFTSISSTRAHNKAGAVIWPIIYSLVPGIIIGSMVGAWLAAMAPVTFLKIFFSCFIIFSAIKIITDYKPKAGRDLPGRLGLIITGLIIGLISTLVGVGGGSLIIPFLLWCNVPMRQSVGTSAGMGFPVALFGTAGYIYHGLGVPDLPEMTLGYIYLPALAAIIAASVITAPIGVKLAHRIPVLKLKRIFACLLIVGAAKMITSI